MHNNAAAADLELIDMARVCTLQLYYLPRSYEKASH